MYQRLMVLQVFSEFSPFCPEPLENLRQGVRWFQTERKLLYGQISQPVWKDTTPYVFQMVDPIQNFLDIMENESV